MIVNRLRAWLIFSDWKRCIDLFWGMSGAWNQVCQSGDACVSVIRRIKPCMDPPIVVLWVDSRQSLDDLCEVLNKMMIQ